MDNLMQHLARIGARVRYDQLIAETQALTKAFPGITAETPYHNGAVTKMARVQRAPAKHEPVKAAQVKRTRKVSAAERKAIGVRMRRYWRERRRAAREALAQG